MNPLPNLAPCWNVAPTQDASSEPPGKSGMFRGTLTIAQSMLARAADEVIE